jgi:hypothetical protein
MERVHAYGWNCAELRSGDVVLQMTLDVGPRIIHLGPADNNLFFVKERTKGMVGGDEYRGHGGHRLWVAPEIPEITYYPENDPVDFYLAEENRIGAASRTDDRGIRREIEVTMLGEGKFEVVHRLRHVTDGEPVLLAPWALSVMRAGGEAWMPGPERLSHEAQKLPSGTLVLWPYTDLSDPRFSFDPEGVRIRQTDASTPQKIGAWSAAGWAGYSVNGWTFKKSFGAPPMESLPDMGCNVEIFTRYDMLEVESLGSLMTLHPGESTEWVEHWHVFAGSATKWSDFA